MHFRCSLILRVKMNTLVACTLLLVAAVNGEGVDDTRLGALEDSYSVLSRIVLDLQAKTQTLKDDLINHQHPQQPYPYPHGDINHHYYGRNDCCLLDIAREQCQKQVAGVNLCKLGTGVYYFLPANGVLRTWWEAQDFCRQRGLQLASIETWQENLLLRNKVNALLGTFPGSYWISLNDQNANTVYQWAGTGLPAWTFPADWHAAGIWSNSMSEQCGAIFKHPNAASGTHWDDAVCTIKNRFICELQKPCLDLVDVNVSC